VTLSGKLILLGTTGVNVRCKAMLKRCYCFLCRYCLHSPSACLMLLVGHSGWQKFLLYQFAKVQLSWHGLTQKN